MDGIDLMEIRIATFYHFKMRYVSQRIQQI